MQFQRRILVFYAVTLFGSALSAIATFLSIEFFLGALVYLSLALSLKTAANASLSYLANRIIQRIGSRKSFIFTQLFGILSLGVLLLGFHYKSSLILLSGVVIAGLPGVLVNILMTENLRVITTSPDQFRKYSGTRELLAGIGMLMAAIAAPILLKTTNIFFILLIDATTFLTGFLILLNTPFPKIVTHEVNYLSFRTITYFKHPDTWIYILLTSAALLLAGFTPLIASSNNIVISQKIPVFLKQSLWIIESLTIVAGSALYLSVRKWLTNLSGRFLLVVNGCFLLPLVLTLNMFAIFGMTLLISFSVWFSFMQFRDDFVLAAGQDYHRVRAYSAISELQRNLIFALSPLILGYLFTNLVISKMVCVIIGIQGVLLFGSLLLSILLKEKENNPSLYKAESNVEMDQYKNHSEILERTFE